MIDILLNAAFITYNLAIAFWLIAITTKEIK